MFVQHGGPALASSLRPTLQITRKRLGVASASVALVRQQFSVLAHAQHGAEDGDAVAVNAAAEFDAVEERTQVPEAVKADRPEAGDPKAAGIEGSFEASPVLPERGGQDPRPQAVTERRGNAAEDHDEQQTAEAPAVVGGHCSETVPGRFENGEAEPADGADDEAVQRAVISRVVPPPG